jgi:hypothetical protein
MGVLPNLDNNYSTQTILQKEFRQLYSRAENKRSDFVAPKGFARKGGFFQTKKREQLLGLRGKSGGRVGDNTMTHFWREVREQVETALIDFLLFIRTAEDKDVNLVIKRETLEPIIRGILEPDQIVPRPKPNPVRAKIALMLIINGLQYLRDTTSSFTTSSQVRMIQDAVDISKQLTALLVPENERAEILTEVVGI